LLLVEGRKTFDFVIFQNLLLVHQVKLDKEVCVEEFSTLKALGRVFLRSRGNTVAVGIVTRILDQEA
jgi:translation elongation factor EF-1alpha